MLILMILNQNHLYQAAKLTFGVVGNQRVLKENPPNTPLLSTLSEISNTILVCRCFFRRD